MNKKTILIVSTVSALILSGSFYISSLALAETFACGDTLIDSRDSKTYSTVLIGTQCWMAQNLDYDNGCSSVPWANFTDVGWCGYYSGIDYNEGLLYQWSAAMNGFTAAGAQGLCPTGWHIPTHDEFTTLERAVCTSASCATDFPYDTTMEGFRGTDEGIKIKSGGTSGFNSLLTGYRNDNGAFASRTSYAFTWSSSEGSLMQSRAWYRYLSSSNATIARIQNNKAYGFSVRCIKTTINNDADVPNAPIIGSATAEINARATITFTPPAYDGGSAITGYIVTSDPGGLTGTGSASPITVSNLNIDTAYKFTVRAINAVGTSPASAASNSVMLGDTLVQILPDTVGQSCSSLCASMSRPCLSVGTDVDATNGFMNDYVNYGSTYFYCRYNLDVSVRVASWGQNASCSTLTEPATAVGVGIADCGHATFQTKCRCGTAEVPGAPTGVSATAGDSQASVAFTAPSSGGSIIEYTVISDTGDITAVGSASPITVTGLTNNTVYTFTVTATNAVGTGPESEASNAVTPGKKLFRSVQYKLAPTERTVTNPLTRKVETQTIVPKYTCTPYTEVYSGVGPFGPYYYTNYGEYFTTKEEAINATMTSLTNCLNISYPNTIGDSTNYVISGIGGFRPLFFDPARVPYDNNFKAKSVCATTPVSGSYFLVSNSNTCTLNNGIYNGISRQVDYIRYVPETVHLRTLFCYNTGLSGCGISEAVVPTYKYDGDLNLQIKAINHGFEITWANLAENVEAEVYYDIAKRDSYGLYNIIINRTTNTIFSDNRLKDPTVPQYYEIRAYSSNNSLISTERVDSSELGIAKNEISVTLNGYGFSSIETEINSGLVSVSMTNNDKDPGFIISCSNLIYQNNTTLFVDCDVTNAPTGEYDILLKTPQKTYTLAKPDGFTVSYPTATNIELENILSDLSNGILKIGSIKGDNLYIGAIIGVKVGDRKSINHYTLNKFNYDTNTFYCDDQVACPDGFMKFSIADIMTLANGDLSLIEIYLANDDGSIISEYKDPITQTILTLQDLNLTCERNSWGDWNNGDPVGLCPTNSSTRIDNCGVSETIFGGLQCDPMTQLCNKYSNQCVCKPQTKEELCLNKPCGLARDNCGNLISCSGFTNGVCGPTFFDGSCTESPSQELCNDEDRSGDELNCINSASTYCCTKFDNGKCSYPKP